MKQTLFLLALLLLPACSSDTYQTLVTPPPVAPAPAPADPIASVVSEANAERAALGQSPLTRGLRCTLYTVPTSVTAIVGASLTTVGSWGYKGDFNISNASSSPGVSVLPASVRSVYTSYYVVKCVGSLIVPESGLYSFELSSDDGALLYVNGLLINNDGLHAVTTKSAVKFLSRGVSSFELDYLDIGGSHALVLKSGGVVLPAENLYH